MYIMINTVLPNLCAMNSPIMVTGHTGFKGTWMSLFLDRLGFRVIGVALKANNKSLYKVCNLEGKFDELYCDINDQESITKIIEKFRPAVIFHLAAQPLVLESYNEPFYTFKTNALGCATLLNSASKFDFIKFIGIATTDKVYKNENKKIKFKEHDSLQGSDPYSSSKVAAEAVVRSWQLLSKLNNGPKIVSLRSGNVLGGGDFAKDRLVPDLINGVLNNHSVVIRNPNSTRPWMYVLDTLYGYLLSAENYSSLPSFSAINFSPKGKSLKVIQIVNILKMYYPELSIEFSSSLTLEAESLELNSKFANTKLNWKPFLDQKQALIETINWWNEYSINKASPLNTTIRFIDLFINNIK